jgi:hypothetical protein
MSEMRRTWVLLWVAEAKIDLALAVDDVGNAKIGLMSIEVLHSCVEIFLVFQKDHGDVIEL